MSIPERLLNTLFLGAINHQVTYILVEAGIFAPHRELVSKRSHWLAQLVHCHLCMGTWVGFWISLVFRPGLVHVSPLPGVSRVPNSLFQNLVRFFADAFLIAFIGRVYNEVVAIYRREVEVKKETAELIDAMEHETEARAHGG